MPKERPSGGSSLSNYVLPPGTAGRLLAVLVVLLSAGAISASAQVVIRERVELQAPQPEEHALFLDQSYGRRPPAFLLDKYSGEATKEGGPRAAPYASKTSSEGPVHLRWQDEVQGFVVEGGSGQLHFRELFVLAGYPLNATISVSVSGADAAYTVDVPAGQEPFEHSFAAEPGGPDPSNCQSQERFRPYIWRNKPFDPSIPPFMQRSSFDCDDAADPATPWVDIGPVEKGDIVRVVYNGAGQIVTDIGEGPEGISYIGSGYWCPRGERSYREVSWFADLGPHPCDPSSILAGFIEATLSVKADPVGLDYFEITFDPTPLPYQKIASVFVQAKDVDGNNVELADNTPLTITLTGGSHLGSLRRSIVGGANTTLETTYGAVKPNGGASGIVFFADGENAATLPEDERVVEVTVEKTGEVERQGSSSLGVLGAYTLGLIIEPNTLGHDSEAILRVQAYDLDGNPAILPDETQLDFRLSATGAELGALTWGGVRGTEIIGVPYGDARAWKVHFVADGERPETPTAASIYVDGTNDRALFAEGEVVVDDRFRVEMEIPSPSEIWPTLLGGHNGGRNVGRNNVKQEIKVLVTNDGQPVANQAVEMSVRMILPSGGHDHEEQPGEELLGGFNGNSGGRFEGTTDESGELTLAYQAPTFGGQFEIKARTEYKGKTVETEKEITVRVPNLVELGGGPNYELVGAPSNHAGTNDSCRPTVPTSEHEANHYGTQAMVDALENIVDDYAQINAGVRLRMNDISLEYGGLFDTGNDWQNGHAEHRIGNQADVGDDGINEEGECVALNERDMKPVIEKRTEGELLIHGSHYHIRVQ